MHYFTRLAATAALALLAAVAGSSTALAADYPTRLVKWSLAELGGVPIGGTHEEFGKVIAAETEKWAKVVAASGATVD